MGFRILKKCCWAGFYLRSWQRRPSGKQSLPVPLSGSLPQSSGNSGSFPVATGASVPSSTNVGLPMSWTADMNGCKKFEKPWKAANGNWALAAGRRTAAKRKHWSLIIGCSLDHWCNETVGLLKRSALSASAWLLVNNMLPSEGGHWPSQDNG